MSDQPPIKLPYRQDGRRSRPLLYVFLVLAITAMLVMAVAAILEAVSPF